MGHRLGENRRRRWQAKGRIGDEEGGAQVSPAIADVGAQCLKTLSITQELSPSLDAMSMTLANGFKFPLLGFGTWNLRGPICKTALRAAFGAGHRLLDTASGYGNEADVGGTWPSGIPQELVVQSKVGPRQMGYQRAREAMDASISHLGRLDVVLIHWPGKSRRQRIETWRALEDVYDLGHVRAIGVSNFLPIHMEQLMQDGARHRPMVNQFELHPLCQSRDIVSYCASNAIAVQSYSTLGGGPVNGSIRKENGTSILLGHPTVKSIASELSRSAAAVCLRWAVQQGFGVIPKSRSMEHIVNNAEVWSFNLSHDQLERLNSLDQDHHFAWDPRTIV